MKRILAGVLACLVAAAGALAVGVAFSAGAARADEAGGPWAQPIDRVQGNWEGKWTSDKGESGKLMAQLIALGRGRYRAYFTPFAGQVPGKRVGLVGEAKETTVPFHSAEEGAGTAAGETLWEGTVADGAFEGRWHRDAERGTFKLERVEKKSPTLGKKPPAGAVVLFDGTSLDGWLRVFGGKPMWKLVKGGAMEVYRGSIMTKAKFMDHELHVEFRTPFMPEARGQGRGNSGVYVQGRYEVQVLDSFGLPAADNECGGIYKKAVPTVNACLPPGEWQTYDITFYAPRFDTSGKMTAKPRMTVIHNGVKIHDDVQIDGICGGEVDQLVDKPGPLMLQDHGNPVQFRNIWAVRLGGK